MKKTIALSLIAIFVFSLIPLAFAQDSAADPADSAADPATSTPTTASGTPTTASGTLTTASGTLTTASGTIIAPTISGANAERLKQAREAKKAGKTQEANTNYKAILLKIVENRNSRLGLMKTKVLETKELSDEQKAIIISTIDAQVIKLSSIKSQIEAAQTREELRAAAESLRNMFTESLWRLFGVRIVSARIEGHVKTAKVLEVRLENLVERAKEKGIDISAEVNSFKDKIAAASDKNVQAKDKLNEAIELMKTPSSENKTKIRLLVNDARKLLIESKGALIEAHSILKEIVSKIAKAPELEV